MIRDVFDNVVSADRFRLKVPPDLRLVLQREKSLEVLFQNMREIFSFKNFRRGKSLKISVLSFKRKILEILSYSKT